MRILIISEAFGKNYYGVEQVLLELNKQLRLHNIPCKILVAKIGDLSDIEADVKEIPADIFERTFRWHPAMMDFFVKEICDFKPDVVHVHGVFTFIQRTAIQVAVRLGVPVLVSPHGALMDWMWNRKTYLYRLGKRIYWNTLLRPVLKKTTFIHAITYLEAEAIKREFPLISQILIPNAVDFGHVPEKPACSVQKEFLFLGRLHPVKGVDLLIKAFSKTNLGDEWRLVIAGPDSNLEYVAYLRKLVADLKLIGHVRFVGPVYGDEKYNLLARAWAVVVPSYSEVIAIVNLESAAMFTPTITTRATGLYDWEEGGGLLVDSSESQLAEALGEVMSWSLDERLIKGKKAHQFVKERYSWEMVTQKWLEAYYTVRFSTHNLNAQNE